MEENIQATKKSRRRIGPILLPLLLIAFGLLLLLDTLGLLGRSAWDILRNLWPLLFIAIGLDALFRRKEIFGPVFWIGLGGVSLLSNFGIFGWDAWNALLRLWPLLLVIAGLEILLGKRSIWLSLLVTAVVVAILAIALGLTGLNLPTQSTIQTTVNEPIGSAQQAELAISMGVGDLSLFSLKDSNALISGQISMDEAQIRSRSALRGDTHIYTLEHTNPVMVPFTDAWQWDLGITPRIPMELEASMGVGSMELTLDEIVLDELDVGQAVGEIEVILPNGDYRAEIDQAVGQVLVEIPQNVPVRLKISRAVSGLSLPSDFEEHNEYHYTPGARGADQYIKIEINQAVGNIIVRYHR